MNVQQLQHQHQQPAAAEVTVPRSTLGEGLLGQSSAVSPPPRQRPRWCTCANLCWGLLLVALASGVGGLVYTRLVPQAGGAPRCPAWLQTSSIGREAAALKGKACPLAGPPGADGAVFADICHPGATGHGGGAEPPAYRCPRVDYKAGVFRCACCGAAVFFAASKYQPAGDGWPAFHGATAIWNGTSSGGHRDSNANATRLNVCSPGGTEVVCSRCGAHLGDFFAAGVQSLSSYYCIDGVCLLPPGAAPGEVCQPKVQAAAAAGQRIGPRFLRDNVGLEA